LLVADSLEIHIAKGYLYFAIFFSLAVETLNIIRSRKIIKVSQQQDAYASLPINK
ncbi:TerC family protein, partial [Klebsiella grimontii]|nr:TerC family protein [Klebsiella grimontii]